MSYAFCLGIDALIIACIGWLGWLVWKGANGFLVFVMLVLVFSMLFPGKTVFTCPKCGHSAEVKVFRSVAGGEMPQSKGEEK